MREEPLERCLWMNVIDVEIDKTLDWAMRLDGNGNTWKVRFETLEGMHSNPTPSSIEPLKVELKAIPSYIAYAYFGSQQT